MTATRSVLGACLHCLAGLAIGILAAVLTIHWIQVAVMVPAVILLGGFAASWLIGRQALIRLFEENPR